MNKHRQSENNIQTVRNDGSLLAHKISICLFCGTEERVPLFVYATVTQLFAAQ